MDEAERFLSKLNDIIDLSEQSMPYMTDLYNSLLQLEGGTEAISAIYNVISEKDKVMLLDYEQLRDEPEFLTIDKDEVLYNKDKKITAYDTKDANYIRNNFDALLSILYPSEIRKVFYYKAEKSKGIIYRVNVIGNSPEETIECLKKCIQLAKGNKRVTYYECMDCSNWLIDMIPKGRYSISWSKCQYAICEAFRSIYLSRGGDSFYELMGRCSAILCETEYWCFINQLESFYSQQQYDDFWNHLRKRMKNVFIDQCFDFYRRENRWSIENNSERKNLVPIVEKMKK